MKKVYIYSLTRLDSGRTEKTLVRTTTVHPTFVGIGKRGEINMAEFKSLANDLEPGIANKHVDVLNA